MPRDARRSFYSLFGERGAGKSFRDVESNLLAGNARAERLLIEIRSTSALFNATSADVVR